MLPSVFLYINFIILFQIFQYLLYPPLQYRHGDLSMFYNLHYNNGDYKTKTIFEIKQIFILYYLYGKLLK